MTLLVMAAGMGSRYGGLKQLDPIGPNGEFILDYTVYDAMKAGFDKVVFVIKEENLEIFKETVGNRIGNKIETAYCFQDLYDLPEGYTVPEGRTTITSPVTVSNVGTKPLIPVITSSRFTLVKKRMPSLSPHRMPGRSSSIWDSPSSAEKANSCPCVQIFGNITASSSMLTSFFMLI